MASPQSPGSGAPETDTGRAGPESGAGPGADAAPSTDAPDAGLTGGAGTAANPGAEPDAGPTQLSEPPNPETVTQAAGSSGAGNGADLAGEGDSLTDTGAEPLADTSSETGTGTSQETPTPATEAAPAGKGTDPKHSDTSSAQGRRANASRENEQASEPEATSPRLEHLEETIDKARNAADDALRGQGS